MLKKTFFYKGWWVSLVVGFAFGAATTLAIRFPDVWTGFAAGVLSGLVVGILVWR